MQLLKVSDISVVQQGFELKHISFTQDQFQKIAITGETGSGKSTLMKTIAGLIQPSGGEVFFDGKQVTGPDYNLIPGHPGIAYLSQRFELRNHYRMEELLSYANELPEQETKEIFALCRIAHLLKRKTDGLSGGEQQRLALAKLLIGKPRLLLLDEPFSNLDPIHKGMLKSVIENIGARLGISCILTSHDPLDTLSWADEIIVMRNGTVIQAGGPQDVYYSPVDEYAAGLFGSYNVIGAEARKALQGLMDKLPDTHTIYIRPEQFDISTDGSGVIGTIINKAFRGSYFEYEIDIAGQKILVNSKNGKVEAGHVISISLC